MVDYITREQYGDLSTTARQEFWDSVVASGFVYDDIERRETRNERRETKDERRGNEKRKK